MDINMSLIGQMITFAVLVWFSMKFVFPALNKRWMSVPNESRMDWLRPIKVRLRWLSLKSVRKRH